MPHPGWLETSAHTWKRGQRHTGLLAKNLDTSPGIQSTRDSRREDFLKQKAGRSPLWHSVLGAAIGSLLALGILAWDFWSQEHLDALGLWTLLLARTRTLVGPADARPTRGLGPARLEAHYWREGPMLGRMPLWPSAPGTLGPSATQHLGPGPLHGDWEQRPRPCGRLWLWNPQAHIPERMEICLSGWPKCQTGQIRKQGASRCGFGL